LAKWILAGVSALSFMQCFNTKGIPVKHIDTNCPQSILSGISVEKYQMGLPDNTDLPGKQLLQWRWWWW